LCHAAALVEKKKQKKEGKKGGKRKGKENIY
jgi:hypothetical protein